MCLKVVLRYRLFSLCVNALWQLSNCRRLHCYELGAKFWYAGHQERHRPVSAHPSSSPLHLLSLLRAY